MLKPISYDQYAKEALEQLQKGAFLTVRAADQTNTMTIAWGAIGYMWNRPVFTVMVRHSRHTYHLMEQASDFTVSFPMKGQLKQALGICGSQSGRDVDKFELSGITTTTVDGLEHFNSPLIEACDLHYACRIVFKQDMQPDLLHTDIRQSAYANGDHHVLYYGEIVSTLIQA